MEFKVGDIVVHIEALEDLPDHYGTVQKITNKNMTIKWTSKEIYMKPWALDGSYGGRASSGRIVIRKLTKLERALK